MVNFSVSLVVYYEGFGDRRSRWRYIPSYMDM